MSLRFFKEKYIYILALLPLMSLFMVSVAITVFFIGSFLSLIYYEKSGNNNGKLQINKVVLLCILPLAVSVIELLVCGITNSLIANNTMIANPNANVICPTLPIFKDTYLLITLCIT